MTKDDIYFYTQAKKELEFQYRGNAYVLNYDKDTGRIAFCFRNAEGKKYSSGAIKIGTEV